MTIDQVALTRDAQSMVTAALAGEDPSALWLEMAGDRELADESIPQWAHGMSVLLARFAASLMLGGAQGDRDLAMSMWQASLAMHGADSDAPAARRLRGEDGA